MLIIDMLWQLVFNKRAAQDERSLDLIFAHLFGGCIPAKLSAKEPNLAGMQQIFMHAENLGSITKLCGHSRLPITNSKYTS